MFGRRDDFFVEEIIDHDGRRVKRTFDGIIVPDIEQPFLLAELPHLPIQHGPQ